MCCVSCSTCDAKREMILIPIILASYRFLCDMCNVVVYVCLLCLAVLKVK